MHPLLDLLVTRLRSSLPPVSDEIVDLREHERLQHEWPLGPGTNYALPVVPLDWERGR